MQAKHTRSSRDNRENIMEPHMRTVGNKYKNYLFIFLIAKDLNSEKVKGV